MNSISATAPVTASLDDPFYYLANFHFVLRWVTERHGDLLTATEHDVLATFAELPRASRALLVRMVMRRGEHFRTSRLDYAEIGDSRAALAPLVTAGLVEQDPALTLDMLFRQLRLPELRRALAAEIRAAGLAPSSGKAVLHEGLAAHLATPRPLKSWWTVAAGRPEGERVVRLTVMALCDRLRLMFFGNLRQDWAEFVLAELGVQRFETVSLDAASRAFQTRDEVDAYLALHRLRERLEAGEAPGELADAVPSVPVGHAWLASRRARLLLRLGREAERGGDAVAALTCYAEAGRGVSGSSEARIRRLRLLERRGEHAEAHALVERALATGAAGEAECQALARLWPRLCRQLGRAAPPRTVEPSSERLDLCLPMTAGGVERAVAEHLGHAAAPVYYVENTLIPGLFGLLCWEAIFAPLPGAFFHPFHAGPADLYREDFVARRREHFDACLANLESGRHGETILATFRAKQGLAAPFAHWGVLTERLITHALACIPPSHLRACFERLLGDLKANRAGLPDLIQCFPDAAPGEPSYRLIEVKGPGDRLQDNQRRWLAFFQAREIPVAVCHVTWQDAPADREGP